MPRLEFKPRLVPTLAAVAGSRRHCAAGQLAAQSRRRKARAAAAHRRAPRISRRCTSARRRCDAADVDYFRVEASGEFKRRAHGVRRQPRAQGVPGYEVVTPLRIGGSARYVLVNRGWVQAGPSRSQLPAGHDAAGTVTRRRHRAAWQPAGCSSCRRRYRPASVWQNLSRSIAIASAFGLDLQPIIIQQHNDLGDGLVRDWNRPDAGNRSAPRLRAAVVLDVIAVILILYVVLNVRRTVPPVDGRLSLLLIAAVAVAPLVGGLRPVLLLAPERVHQLRRAATPTPIADVSVRQPDGSGSTSRIQGQMGAADGRLRARATHSASDKLYRMRQVRLTQGKDMERIERAWLIDDETRTCRRAGQPTMRAPASSQAPGSALLRRLPARGSVRDHIYIVDPLGNLMLRYPRDADPSRMKKDLTRLLKASRIG